MELLFYTGRMLYTASADRPDQHRGTVIHVRQSRFAPAAEALAAHGEGTLDGYGLAAAYRTHLRRLWHQDRGLFLDLVEQVKSTDVTLVDEWPDEGPSPRLVLADVLRVLAAGQTRSGQSGLYVNAALSREERPAP